MRVVDWISLSPADAESLLQRPALRDAAAVTAAARQIVDQVRRDGDSALRDLTLRYDGARLDRFAVGNEEFADAERALSGAEHAAIELSIANVRRFHEAQIPRPIAIDTAPGVHCERLTMAIRAVGLYVPSGSAPLPSTAIMLAVPAAIAACPVRVLCTPPSKSGTANPAVLVAARKAGIDIVYKLGGAQAVAAMAYGTATVEKCDKIFGPGNAWVTAAKLLAAADPLGAAADLPAGVSEVLVIADDGARADFVASDLLAQAEHSVDAQSLLVTDSVDFARRVAVEIERQTPRLRRGAILAQSVANMRIIVAASLQQAFEIANRYAPEHLLLQVREPRAWLPQVTAAGAVFLGPWSPETVGDYCSGPNHTLPTYGYARACSGLGLEDFQRRMTVQELTAAGLQGIGPAACVLAGLEGLDAHAGAVAIRLAALADARR